MMRQPTPRIAAIFMLVGIILWIGALAIAYRAGLRNQPPPLSPQRLAAIVELAETTDEKSRETLLVALRTKGIAVSEESGTLPGASVSGTLRTLDPKDYAVAVAPRPLSIAAPEPQGLRRISAGYFLSYPPVTVFRVGLSGNRILEITVSALPANGMLNLPQGFGAGLFGAIIALVVLAGVIHATHSLAKMAEALDRTDLSGTPEKLPPFKGLSPEVTRLVDAYNRLQDRLRVLMQNRMALIGGISHDVRTFATRLRLRVDAIADRDERERAERDIDDMIRLLDDALIASRAGAGELAEELVDVADILSQEYAARRDGGSDVTLTLDCGTPLHMLGDRLAIRRIVANLVDNALKYGHRARLSGGIAGTRIEIEVEDDGPGIPDEARDAVMEPFFRLEASRSRDSGGAGMGLAVVNSLVQAQSGTIDLQTPENGGSRFVVSFPEFRI